MRNDSGLQPGGQGYRATSLTLLAIGIVAFALLYAMQPLLPWIARHFHLSPAQSSLALSLSTIGLAAGLPLWAAYSDRRGRTRAISTALIGSAALTILLAYAPNFAAFGLMRLAQGLLLAGVPASAMAYIGEEMAPGALGSAMGLYIAGTSGGGMLGRIGVGFAAGPLGWPRTLLLLGTVALALSLLIARTMPPSRHFQPRDRRLSDSLRDTLGLWRRRDLVVPFAIGGLLMAAFVAVYNYLAFLLSGPPYLLPAGIASLVYLFYLLGSFASATLGRLADRVGRQGVLRAAVSLALLGALLTLAPPLWAKLVGVAAFTFAFFGGHSAASTLVSERAGVHRAGASAAYLVTYYVGASLGGSLIGLLWETLCWPGVVLGAVVALVPALLLSLKWLAADLSPPRTRT